MEDEMGLMWGSDDVEAELMQSNRQRTNFREFNFSAQPLPV